MAPESQEKPAKKRGLGLKKFLEHKGVQVNRDLPKHLLEQGRFLLGRSIKGKLLFWLLIISLVPMGLIAYLSYKQSANALQEQSFENLETTLAFQHQALNQYFLNQTETLENIAKTMHVFQQDAYIRLDTIKEMLKKQVQTYFAMRFQDVQAFSASPQQQEVFSELAHDPSAGLDHLYGDFLKEWLEQRDFFSLLMLSPDGQVVYSTDASIQQGASVQDNSPERRALQRGMHDTVFIDYGLSSFGTDNPASYFSTPIVHEGMLEGFLLFSLKDQALDKIMQDIPGLGEHGEAYMVGVDGMFRSNSIYFAESTLANPGFLVDTESVVYALAGESGEETTINYRGDYVLSSYTAVELHGATWVLLVEMEQAEAMAPQIEGEAADHLVQLAAAYGFPNLYLLNLDGYIFYAANPQPDYLTNILTGPYADSNFAEAITQVVEKNEVVISDYKHYAPAQGRPAAFLASPVQHNQETVLIVAVQIPVDQINAIMDVRGQFEAGTTQQAVTTDTYLIGLGDNLWRSESNSTNIKYNVDTTLLNPQARLNTEAVREATAGKSNTKIITNGVDETVLSSWAPFQYKDLNWAIISEISYDLVHAPVNSLLRTIFIITVLAIVAITIVSLLVAGGVTRQVDAIMQAMIKVEQGDYSERAKVTSKDELGRMASSFNSMTETIDGLVTSRQEEHDKLNTSIIQLLEEITLLADGDLTIRATVTDDVIGTLADSLNMMLDELGKAFRRIKDSAEQVSSTAEILSSSTGELAEQNNTQSHLITEAVEKINLLTTAIQDAAAKATQSADTSKISSQVAGEGAGAVRETSHSMEAIRSNVQNTARAIKRLGESSQEISDFARNINEISDRTSILALNASIQAAAAGEEGRGFAVVAEEIQRLAERAAVSTRQIETLIRNILSEITEAGVSMDASIQEVVQGTKLSQNALARLEEITTRSNEVVELIEGVAHAAREQADTTAELADKMGNIGKISLDTAQETMGASVSMREMAVMGEDMLQAVAAFKLEVESASSTI